MKLHQRDIQFRYTRGTGPGGQHKNKTDSCVIATHIPTGLEVRIDGRNQHQNKKQAVKQLEKFFDAYLAEQKASEKKSRRDHAIKNVVRVRTYDYKRGVVTDHRTGKTASIKDILVKGLLDKLR